MTVHLGDQDLKQIPRERWATVMGMIFVQKMPAFALEQIVLEGRRLFVKRGLSSDTVGLKADDYSDIWLYIKLSVQQLNQARVAIDAARETRRSQVAVAGSPDVPKIIM